jgi:hypothetical protein
MDREQPRHLHLASIFHPPALVTPAVRTVVLVAVADCLEGDPAEDDAVWEYEDEVHPVLAIEACRVDKYRRWDPEPEPDCVDPYFGSTEAAPDHAAMVRAGYEFGGHDVRHRVLFASPGLVDSWYGGLVAIDDYLQDHPRAAARVVACPWPADEDEFRLADHVADLRHHAVTRAENRARAERYRYDEAPVPPEVWRAGP